MFAKHGLGVKACLFDFFCCLRFISDSHGERAETGSQLLRAGSEKLAQSKVEALMKQTEPIHAPCCADMLHISGTVVLAISVGPRGNVACVQSLSGHPLIIGVAIDSVRQWKFEPYTSQGVRKLSVVS
jgi:outer membrane biosynthesis protein TonB